MSESPKNSGPAELKQSIERLDAMLAAETVEEKIRAGMGIRLALGMAHELKTGKPLGADTADLVAEWAAHFGQDSVDAAVRIAREFLIKPESMRATLGRKLGLEKGDDDSEDGEELANLEDGMLSEEDDAGEDAYPGRAGETAG
ncbi:MAG: hypothetical protein ABI036_19780 [Fibrobacteria bacterium]